MNTNKYQAWEGEMEAPALEENGISLLTVILSAILGVVLIFILLTKTAFQIIFRLKSGTRKKLSASLDPRN